MDLPNSPGAFYLKFTQDLWKDIELAEYLRGVLTHHDAITGVSPPHTVENYFKLIKRAR
jgi:hypothetical protein